MQKIIAAQDKRSLVAAKAELAAIGRIFRSSPDRSGSFEFRAKSPLVIRMLREVGRSDSATDRQHAELLNRSILVALATYLEILVADLVHVRHELYPN